jgi:hypothetical protein
VNSNRSIEKAFIASALVLAATPWVIGCASAQRATWLNKDLWCTSHDAECRTECESERPLYGNRSEACEVVTVHDAEAHAGTPYAEGDLVSVVPICARWKLDHPCAVVATLRASIAAAKTQGEARREAISAKLVEARALAGTTDVPEVLTAQSAIDGGQLDEAERAADAAMVKARRIASGKQAGTAADAVRNKAAVDLAAAVAAGGAICDGDIPKCRATCAHDVTSHACLRLGALYEQGDPRVGLKAPDYRAASGTYTAGCAGGAKLACEAGAKLDARISAAPMTVTGIHGHGNLNGHVVDTMMFQCPQGASPMSMGSGCSCGSNAPGATASVSFGPICDTHGWRAWQDGDSCVFPCPAFVAHHDVRTKCPTGRVAQVYAHGCLCSNPARADEPGPPHEAPRPAGKCDEMPRDDGASCIWSCE